MRSVKLCAKTFRIRDIYIYVYIRVGSEVYLSGAEKTQMNFIPNTKLANFARLINY